MCVRVHFGKICWPKSHKNIDKLITIFNAKWIKWALKCFEVSSLNVSSEHSKKYCTHSMCIMCCFIWCHFIFHWTLKLCCVPFEIFCVRARKYTKQWTIHKWYPLKNKRERKWREYNVHKINRTRLVCHLNGSYTAYLYLHHKLISDVISSRGHKFSWHTIFFLHSFHNR